MSLHRSPMGSVTLPGFSAGVSAILLAVLLALLALVLPDRAASMIYIGDGSRNTIGRANLDGKKFKPLFLAPGEALRVGGIAVSNSHVFWVDEGRSSIGRANLRGRQVRPDFIDVNAGVWAMAVHQGRIYWNNHGNGHFGRARMNGSQVNHQFTPSAIPGVENMIANGGALFTAGDSGSLGRVMVDGSFSMNIGTVDADGVAAKGKFAYWIDGDTNFAGRIRLSNLNKNEEFFPVQTGSVAGMAIQGNYIYWIDYTNNKVGRATLDGKKVNPNFINLTGLISPWSIAVDWIRNPGKNFRIGKLKGRALTIDNPGPGKLTVSGTGLSKVSVNAKGPNTKVRLKLTPAFAAILANEGIREIKVKVTFKPSLGSGKKTKSKRFLIT